MIIPDQLTVTAMGSSRAKMLEDADEQAASYFEGVRHRRLNAQAEVAERALDGSSIVFEAVVIYEAERE